MDNSDLIGGTADTTNPANKRGRKPAAPKTPAPAADAATTSTAEPVTDAAAAPETPTEPLTVVGVDPASPDGDTTVVVAAPEIPAEYTINSKYVKQFDPAYWRDLPTEAQAAAIAALPPLPNPPAAVHLRERDEAIAKIRNS